MGFLKKLSKSTLKQMRASAGYREREAIDNQYARLPVKWGKEKGVKFLYWRTDYRGKKYRDSAVYVQGRGWVN